MIEKVNPTHPDKVADRIAGAIVDLAYQKAENPKIAVEVLIGHKKAFIVIESNVNISNESIHDIVYRLSEISSVEVISVAQDAELARNQHEKLRAGDNGIFKGIPTNSAVKELSDLVKKLFNDYPTDGKYILDDGRLIVCQSHASSADLRERLQAQYTNLVINPLGDWTGGLDVDTGATNRKLGSDMGEAVTGGGLHGKDLSKADVAVNIYAYLKAQQTGEVVNISCAIGDEMVDGLPYSEIVEIARKYIEGVGGFEKFAEWGLV